jgi:hypothetical protein
MTSLPDTAARPLTETERRALSPGLWDALMAAGVKPQIRSRAHLAARIAGLWLGGTPVLARPRLIHWPGAPADLDRCDDPSRAVLQHELQHLLDYATGAMSALGYLTRPRNWRYGYELAPGSRWSDFGCEQRASIAEHLWLLEHGRQDLVRDCLGSDPAPLAEYRRLIPWAPTRP